MRVGGGKTWGLLMPPGLRNPTEGGGGEGGGGGVLKQFVEMISSSRVKGRTRAWQPQKRSAIGVWGSLPSFASVPIMAF